MRLTVLFVTTVVAVVGASTPYYYPVLEPRYSSSSSHGQSYSYVPMPYSFKYIVNDRTSNNDYGHEEKSDGNVVTGSYFVVLPDGRRQVVTYRADYNGYVADVKYEEYSKTYYIPSYSSNPGRHDATVPYVQTSEPVVNQQKEYPRPYYPYSSYPRPSYQPTAVPAAESSSLDTSSTNEANTEAVVTPSAESPQVQLIDTNENLDIEQAVEVTQVPTTNEQFTESLVTEELPTLSEIITSDGDPSAIESTTTTVLQADDEIASDTFVTENPTTEGIAEQTTESPY